MSRCISYGKGWISIARFFTKLQGMSDTHFWHFKHLPHTIVPIKNGWKKYGSLGPNTKKKQLRRNSANLEGCFRSHFFFSAVASSKKKKKEKKNKPKTSSEASFWQPLLVHHQEPHLHLPQKKHGRGGGSLRLGSCKNE